MIAKFRIDSFVEYRTMNSVKIAHSGQHISSIVSIQQSYNNDSNSRRSWESEFIGTPFNAINDSILYLIITVAARSRRDKRRASDCNVCASSADMGTVVVVLSRLIQRDTPIECVQCVHLECTPSCFPFVAAVLYFASNSQMIRDSLRYFFFHPKFGEDETGQ